MNKRLIVLSENPDTFASAKAAVEPSVEVVFKKGLSPALRAISGSELVLLDLKDNASAMRELKSYHPDAEVLVVVNGNAEVGKGAYDYLESPLAALRLKRAIKNAFGHISMKAALDGLSRRGEETIIGRSPGMLKALKQMEGIALKDVPVAIVGERGTGRGLIAAAIHGRSPRRAGPFVVVENPSEEALFGGPSGGKIAEAVGGSIFLKGVNEALGKKLSEFISCGSCLIGGAGPIEADVRVMCVPESDEVPEDFKAIIKLPPLRERPEDIMPLAGRFLKDAEVFFGNGTKALTKDAQKSLQKHHFPGNVKELETTVKRAYVLSRGEKIEKYHLGHEEGSVYGSVREFLDDKLKRYIKGMAAAGSSGLYDTVVAEVEKALIEMTLNETGGNQLKAAKTLGLNRNTLRAKMKGYGIKKK